MDGAKVTLHDNVTESNENFDCVLFPEKEKKIEEKVFIAIRKYNPETERIDLGHQACKNMKNI